MTVQTMLLEELARNFPNDAQAALARRAKIKPQRFNNYAQGIRSMDDDAVIGCAVALGLDAKGLVLRHNAEIARTERAKALWKKLATAAALALAVLPGMGSAPAHVRLSLQARLNDRPSMHYAK